MFETAAHLVEHLFTRLPVRQWARLGAVDEGHRTEACRGTATGTVFTQTVFHYAQQ